MPSKEEVLDVTGWNVYQRVLGIMSELSYIQKGDKQVNNQYRFVGHDQVTAKIHPLSVKYRVLMIPTVAKHSQEGNRTTVDQIVHFVNVDKPEDQFSINTFGYGVDPSDKGPGKAMSYAFKLAALKTLMLETGEDPDQDQKSVYEPVKCLEFDLMIPQSFTEAEKKKLNKFLIESAEAQGKHVEEIKRSAVDKMEQFLEVFKKWGNKK
jgi:hypothetical protein